MATYTVKKGDTLSEIAWKYNSTYKYGSNATETCKRLAEINDIDNPDKIVVGQVLTLDNPKGSSGGNAAIAKKKDATAKTATIKAFGLQTNTDRTMYAEWTWDKKNTENYKIKWFYDTGDGVWFVAEDTTTTVKQATYTAPSNAKRVKFKVKPMSKTHKVKGKVTKYWTSDWSTEQIHSFSENPPPQPSAPTVTIDKYTLTATLSNIEGNATNVQFEVVKNDSSVFAYGVAAIATASASYSWTIGAGGQYKARCRLIRGSEYGAWSEYSSNATTMPEAPQGITSISALSSTSVQLNWTPVPYCTSYDIQYTTKAIYFDSAPSEVKTVSVESVVSYAIVTGLESGSEYFFRVRATNSHGSSPWTGSKSIIIGKAPAAPTTWSSTTTAITGESVTLYWVHNSEDGSSQTYAEIEFYINGVRSTVTVQNTSDEDEKNKTSSYSLNTSIYTEGSKIQWRVRTAGITKTYGDWSVQRTIDIYAPPTLEFSITDANGTNIGVINSFPFYAKALAGPNTQRPIGYHLTITSDEFYETEDQIGNMKIVNTGDAVYSRYFDISEPLIVELSAGNIDLENGISYTAVCTVSMDSGLKTEAAATFSVAWVETKLGPNAEISYDNDTYAVHIRPYCVDPDENLVENVTLSVYRREYDGGFIEIASGLKNSSSTFVTDPHPALDYARYRVVVTTDDTGTVSYYDLPGYPTGETSVIIQWNEEWSSFDTSDVDEADEPEQPPWSGSLLRLPYNIDVSDKNSLDVSLVKYIGRKRPVSYYGTQLGESSTWKVEIEKEDTETLYALRRLSIWTGDVYVREPSGSGYWANISVSFSQTHCQTTIPVTLEITRVEGGI